MPNWTIEQILALAPDASSFKAGKELASVRKWVRLGKNNQLIWGECQGSGKNPYQTQIDLDGPAFKCTCPSRKFPCKHALGLLILSVEDPGAFSQDQSPAWVEEWLTKRAAKAEAKPPASKAKADPAAQTRRAEKREERIQQGLNDLEIWLEDLVRQGLKPAQSQPPSFWEIPAARLVDAQASGLARRIREMAIIPASGSGWETRLAHQIVLLHLAVQGYRRLASLPPEVQADLHTLIGWTTNQDDLLNQSGVRDTWCALSRWVDEEPLPGRSAGMRVQRTWYFGTRTHRFALILQFAPPGMPLDPGLSPGMSVETELVYFPSAYPQRALEKNRFSSPVPMTGLPGACSIQQAVEAWSAARSAFPWLETFPMSLAGVKPVQVDGSMGIYDSSRNFLPFLPGFTRFWSIMALSGGSPVNLFATWNGQYLRPGSVEAQGRFVILSLDAGGD